MSSANQKSISRRRELRLSLVDGSAFSLMTGIGEQYFPAFMLAANLGALNAGLITTVPVLLGAMLQLFAPRWAWRFGSLRRWVVACVTLQGCALVPLIVSAALQSVSTPLVFFCVSVYWAAGMAASPAWNLWISSVTPAACKVSFFTKRARCVQVFTFLGFLGGGWALHAFSVHPPLHVFAALFSVAFAARCVSIFCLSQQREPLRLVPDQGPQSVSLRWARPGEPWAPLVAYLLCIQFTVYLASPFFTPFWFDHAHMTYTQYTLLVATAMGTKFLCVPLWGRAARHYGALVILRLAGFGIAFLPALWLFSSEFQWMLAFQVLSGLFWGGHELGVVLSMLQHIPNERKTSVLSAYNFYNAVALGVGSLIGASILNWFQADYMGYLFLFCFSALARGATLRWFSRIPATLPAWPQLLGTMVFVKPGATASMFLAFWDATRKIAPAARASLRLAGRRQGTSATAKKKDLAYEERAS